MTIQRPYRISGILASFVFGCATTWFTIQTAQGHHPTIAYTIGWGAGAASMLFAALIGITASELDSMRKHWRKRDEP
jgi:hypothetical protein